MDAAQQLFNRLTEVEKLSLMRLQTEDALVGRYYDYQPELSGGHLHGGTVEEGIAQLKTVHAKLNAAYVIDSQNPLFGRTWAY